ncbi:MAG: selenocysteine-specific translation elongation factor [Candidatus Limnocylindria bacterium]
MTVVVGTAGHIDHGKTTLLRALTGIDADRLPEERRRGMTIDVGYAHVALDDGVVLDFVDVPGHERLVGNMLVGAGEIDAAMLVVAADDGPRAQTFEHLALLDALGIESGLVVLTKIDVVEPERVAEIVAAVERLLAPTALAGSRVLPASGATGAGLDEVRAALGAVASRVVPQDRPPTLAVDRVFAVRGRGTVVTGSLRGGRLARGDVLRIVPGPGSARIREIQVHGSPVEAVVGGGRTALNVVVADGAPLRRGVVLTADPAVQPTDRLLVAVRSDPADRSRWRLHVGTSAVDAIVGRAGRDALDGFGILRLAEPVAAAPGDRFVLRRPGSEPIGGAVVDVAPPRGISRRRQTAERVAALAHGDGAARLDLHGALVAGGTVALAADVLVAAQAAALAAAADGFVPLPTVRTAVARAIRRLVTLRRDDALVAATAVVDDLVRAARMVRHDQQLALPTAKPVGPDPATLAAMERLVGALDVPAPPPLGEAARAAGCPPSAIRDLERAGRLVVLEPDLAYAMATYQRLAARAIDMARRAPLTPAAFRDATGTSRKYVMAILEDLDRRALLRRTLAGHVPGPRAPGPS